MRFVKLHDIKNRSSGSNKVFQRKEMRESARIVIFNIMYIFIFLISLISHASKILLKVIQGRMEQYVNRELPEEKKRKRRGTRDQIANIRWMWA